MTCTCHHGGYHDPANYECDRAILDGTAGPAYAEAHEGDKPMSKKTFHIQYGTHCSDHVSEGYFRKRKDAERIRRWWVDSKAPGRDPRDRWAVIHEERA